MAVIAQGVPMKNAPMAKLGLSLFFGALACGAAPLLATTTTLTGTNTNSTFLENTSGNTYINNGSWTLDAEVQNDLGGTISNNDYLENDSTVSNAGQTTDDDATLN